MQGKLKELKARELEWLERMDVTVATTELRLEEEEGEEGGENFGS